MYVDMFCWRKKHGLGFRVNWRATKMRRGWGGKPRRTTWPMWGEGGGGEGSNFGLIRAYSYPHSLKINIDAVKKKNYTWVWCRYLLEKLAAEASGRRLKWQKSEQTCMVSLFHAQGGCLVICLLSDKRVLHMVMLLGGGIQSLVVDEKELSRWFQINTM